MKSKFLSLAVFAVSIAGCMSASATTVSVLDSAQGNSAWTSFFQSQGITANSLTTDFNATDIANIANSALVIFDFNNPITSTQLTVLTNYVLGGGRLVVQSDGTAFSGSWIANLNAVSSSLGSSIFNQSTSFDFGLQTTTNIVASPFTTGVSNINYGLTSSLIGGNPLVIGHSGQTFVAYQAIGSGEFFAVADTSLVINANDPTFGNGQLYLNFIGAAAVPGPTVGAGASSFALAALFLGWLVRRRGRQVV